MRNSTPLYRRSVGWLALAALLVAQAIGLAHGIAHPRAKAYAAAQAQHQTPASASTLDHDEGSAQCRLLDQLWHADALVAVASTTAAPPAQTVGADVHEAAPALRAAWRPLARAPPTFLA